MLHDVAVHLFTKSEWGESLHYIYKIKFSRLKQHTDQISQKRRKTVFNKLAQINGQILGNSHIIRNLLLTFYCKWVVNYNGLRNIKGRVGICNLIAYFHEQKVTQQIKYII